MKGVEESRGGAANVAPEAPVALEAHQRGLPRKGTLELKCEGWERTERSSKGVPGWARGRHTGLGVGMRPGCEGGVGAWGMASAAQGRGTLLVLGGPFLLACQHLDWLSASDLPACLLLSGPSPIRSNPNLIKLLSAQEPPGAPHCLNM